MDKGISKSVSNIEFSGHWAILEQTTSTDILCTFYSNLFCLRKHQGSSGNSKCASGLTLYG